MNSILVETIICPHCHAELKVHHETCPYCHTSLTTASTHSAIERDDPQSVLDRPWIIAVLLLHVGFLGIPLYWKTRYSVATRVMICLLSVVYTVFAVGVIVGVGSYIYQRYQQLFGG